MRIGIKSKRDVEGLDCAFLSYALDFCFFNLIFSPICTLRGGWWRVRNVNS